MQIINKPTGSKIAMLKAEVDILQKCDHPNVVKMHACYETDKILYLVLELVPPPTHTSHALAHTPARLPARTPIAAVPSSRSGSHRNPEPPPSIGTGLEPRPCAAPRQRAPPPPGPPPLTRRNRRPPLTRPPTPDPVQLTGGELFDSIIAKGHYSEADARTLTITLLDAIK